MKFDDAVYLVRPVAKIPTRRAFLFAAGTFVIGTSVGGACGYSMGVASAAGGGGTGDAGAAPPSAPAVEPELKPSGDAQLDMLRKLAVKAPLDDLFANALVFLDMRVSTYPKDEVLWLGVERLAREIVNNPARQVAEGVVFITLTQIEGAARPVTPSLRELVPSLRSRREQIRRRK